MKQLLLSDEKLEGFKEVDSKNLKIRDQINFKIYSNVEEFEFNDIISNNKIICLHVNRSISDYIGNIFYKEYLIGLDKYIEFIDEKYEFKIPFIYLYRFNFSGFRLLY